MAMILRTLTDGIFHTLHKTQRPVFLRGAPGIGKTQRPEQFCADNGFGYVHEVAPTQDSPDIRGILMARKDGTSRYLMPDWLRRIYACIEAGMTKGVLFVDELPSGNLDVIKAWCTVLSERRIGEFELPEGWVVWAAGNRPEDKAGANKLPAHATNRMRVLDIEPDLDGLLAYAAQSGKFHPMYLAFLQFRPDAVLSTTPPSDPNAPRCTPRSFEAASEFHSEFSDGTEMGLSTREDVMEIVGGSIGPVSVEMATFLNTTGLLPTYKEVMADPQGAKLPPSERIDAHFAAAQMLTHYADEDNVDKLFTYALRLRQELQVSIAKQCLAKSTGFLQSTVMGKFIRENRDMIVSTMDK